MNEQEQSENEMNLAFELLENLIKELPVTIARQDLLLTYAGQLKEAAYRAGKAATHEIEGN